MENTKLLGNYRFQISNLRSKHSDRCDPNFPMLLAIIESSEVDIVKNICLPEVESRTQGSRPWPRTKKIRSQGQPFRGQTLSRPRTGMHEAKDLGRSRKCSPKKKKRYSKKFFRRSPIHRRTENF